MPAHGVMTEAELQANVLELAALLGWHCYHARPARTANGWRTAAQGNGAIGFPDCVLARNGHVIFAELKAQRGTVSSEQRVWLDRLEAVAAATPRVVVHTWRPANWLNGDIEWTLKYTGTAEVAA